MAFTEKEIKVRYKKAVFGFLWMLIQPVSQMVVIGIVVHFITQVPIEEYFPFLLAGLLPWTFFAMTLSKTTPAYVHERHIIQKANFPREIMVLSMVLANAVHFVLTLGLFLVVLAFLGKISNLGWVAWLMLPVSMVWLIAFTTGLSLLTSALNVRYRDINFMIAAGLPIWFYATPILYSLDLLPAMLHTWIYLNPMTGIIESFKFALLGVAVTDPIGVWYSLGFSLVITLLGIWVFRNASPYFVDWV